MTYTHLIIHYGELSIKGKNRPFFENQLLNNTKSSLKTQKYDSIKRGYGRLIITLNKSSNLEAFKEQLKKVFGISNFSFSISSDLDIESLKSATSSIVKNEKNKSFAIKTKRSNKNFPLNSMEVNKIIGQQIKDSKNKINLDNPDITIFIEITEKNCFIYTEKIKGLQGLPVGVSGNVLSLLSGGIDSPVASYLMLKRGCKVTHIHFFNETINKSASLNKVKDLTKNLSKYQPNSKLYLIPFKDIQFEIVKQVPDRYRMLLYRRFMLRIAEKIAKKENAKALIVGDSLAQVSSQIIDCMKVIRNVSKMLIFSPLIGFDKQEIINLAKEIGTYETSIQPYGDCCSFMTPKHPELRPQEDLINKYEKNIKVDKLIEKAVKDLEIIKC